MRLKKIQVAGFKSFVDPTDIRLPADFVAVVGPNGCGKSNIIDAVRWVMGETSARLLRGDSMADVIFNGSSARKPVGRASVELVFDNADRSAGGNFAKFAEISVKRSLSRDGHSDYFINRIKTRRKDVLDLFRGTGLGPRSYSIIEQGMVSRIIESRPEDLRMFVEEAAGTSRYKDRRRETETRIRHTHENLERVADIRDELDKQLRRLKRQASAAQRYKTLREEQRLLNGQLLMITLGELDEQLSQQERQAARGENDLQAATAAQRTSEAEIEQLRDRQSESREQHARVQQDCYNLGAEVKHLEQRIEHLHETRRQRSAEVERLRAAGEQHRQQLASEQSCHTDLLDAQTSLAPQVEALARARQQAEQQLAEAERALDAWQGDWENFTEQAQHSARQQEVQQSRIDQLEQHLKRADEQTSRLEQELVDARRMVAEIDIQSVRTEVQRHDDECELSEREFQQTETSIQSLEKSTHQKREQNDRQRARQHEAQSRLTSLRQIQTAALGGDDTALQSWLQAGGLAQQPKLAARIAVADGWQRAADRLLSGSLGAVCVEKLPQEALAKRPDCALMLVANELSTASTPPDTHGRARLLDKVTAGETDLSGFLGGVFVAESWREAVAMQPDLGNRECVVTRDGALVGANWVSFASKSQLETGVLVREEEINQLQHNLTQLDLAVTKADAEIDNLENQRAAKRRQRDELHRALTHSRAERTAMHATLGRQESRQLEISQRIAALVSELGSLGGHAHSDHGEIDKARTLLQHAAERQADLGARRDDLLRDKAQRQDRVTECREGLRQAGEQAHKQALHAQRLEAEIAAAAADIARIETQLREAGARLAQLGAASDSGESVAELNTQLQEMLARKVEVEQRLAVAADALDELDNRLERLNEQRASWVSAVSESRKISEQHNLARREIVVRRDTQIEQIDKHGYDRDALQADLPADADREICMRRCDELEQKINRIGPVNLVAIEEFDEESERKEYLDRQYADLTEALETLRSVIRKIDRETRVKFKDTFERLNAGFNDFFPQLFGGGTAELQLTEDDFLTAGVLVMARPPGKRNSHIHLLSGGEKALTAVALLFALFKLNPAPFCMLDEVDAPLDDANVERYCETLKSLVKVSQMLVITHNKITMQAAQVLVGVTMGEPGVSRLVSVDIEQAVQMAAQ